MLGKLIKYEFKACGRVFFPIYLVILILSIINGMYSQYGFIQSLKNDLSQKGICSAAAFFTITFVDEYFW